MEIRFSLENSVKGNNFLDANTDRETHEHTFGADEQFWVNTLGILYDMQRKY